MDFPAIKARHEADCIRNWDERNAMQIHMDRHELIAALEERSKPEDSANAIIEDGAIVIRVPLDNLQAIMDGGYVCNAYPERYKVTDTEGFAKEVVRELNDEDEEGTTPVHKLFDAAINEALNQGAQHAEPHEDQNVGGRLATDR